MKRGLWRTRFNDLETHDRAARDQAYTKDVLVRPDSDLVTADGSENIELSNGDQGRHERPAVGIAHRHAKGLASTDDIAEAVLQHGREYQEWSCPTTGDVLYPQLGEVRLDQTINRHGQATD